MISLMNFDNEIYLITSKNDIECYNVEGDIYNEIKNDDLEQIINKAKMYKEQNINKKIVIIYDDYNQINDINKSNKFIDIIANSKYLNIINILTLDCYKVLKPEIISKFDIMMFFYNNNISYKKKFYDKYFSIIPKFKYFNSIFNNIKSTYCLLSLYNNDIYYYQYNLLPNSFIFKTNKINKDTLLNKDTSLNKDDKIKIIYKLLEQNDKLIDLLNNL